MISRRQMLQMAGVFGAMSVLPQSLAAKPFPTAPDRDIRDMTEGTSPDSALDFLEAVEDLEDEVDCVELVGRYSKVVKSSDSIHASADWPGGHCPFCGNAGCCLRVEDFGFFTGCSHHGGGVDWISQVEGIPLPESVQRLRGMLDRGDLIGYRRRIEIQDALYESLAAKCHGTLMNHSPETPQWERLNELTKETIRHNQIGWLSLPLLRSFLTDLRKAGWSLSEPDAAWVINPSRLNRWPRDWAALVMPVRDNRNRILGFVDLTHPRDGWTRLISANVFTYRRWERVIIRNRHTASGSQEAGPLVLTSNAREAVLLWQHGFALAVAEAGGWNRRNLRRILAMNTKFTYVSSVEYFRSHDFILLLSMLGHDASRFHIVVLSDGLTVTDYLRKHGAHALRARLDSAVPVGRILRT